MRNWRSSTGTLMVLILAAGALATAAPAHAINCQYQGRPTSVFREAPGFGVAFGTFHLINSPVACPHNIQAIQFSGATNAQPEPFIGTIETCLNLASLVVVNNGKITFGLDDPLTGEPGVLIGNTQNGPLAFCRISQ
jgi:hypothetical protein